MMRRQGEIMTETMQAIQEAVADLMKANDGKDLPKKQAELVEKTIGRAFKHMRELAELADQRQQRRLQDHARPRQGIDRGDQELAEKISAGKK